jgi:chorismate lyase
MPPSGSLRQWLTDRGSLTARIVGHVAGFNLVRLRQGLARPHRDERRALGLRAGELAMRREVLLRDGDHTLVFAHTVAHPRDLAGAWRGLSKLGARPLAEMLFHDARVVRMPIEYRRLNVRHALFRAACVAAQLSEQGTASLWARRSVFLKAGRPLLVTEVFVGAAKLAHEATTEQCQLLTVDAGND